VCRSFSAPGSIYLLAGGRAVAAGGFGYGQVDYTVGLGDNPVRQAGCRGIADRQAGKARIRHWKSPARQARDPVDRE
jgi:hypothetical protein